MNVRSPEDQQLQNGVTFKLLQHIPFFRKHYPLSEATLEKAPSGKEKISLHAFPRRSIYQNRPQHQLNPPLLKY